MFTYINGKCRIYHKRRVQRFSKAHVTSWLVAGWCEVRKEVVFILSYKHSTYPQSFFYVCSAYLPGWVRIGDTAEPGSYMGLTVHIYTHHKNFHRTYPSLRLKDAVNPIIHESVYVFNACLSKLPFPHSFLRHFPENLRSQIIFFYSPSYHAKVVLTEHVGRTASYLFYLA